VQDVVPETVADEEARQVRRQGVEGREIAVGA
jgi:hypothetical protein